MKRQSRSLFFITGWLILAGWHASAAQAAVSLDVRLVRGGLDLDFGTIQQPAPVQEVELTMTNSGSGQYRVYQELPNYLVNEHGQRLPDDALLMQISRGTSGSIATGAVIAVSSHAQELFVSSASGSSDTLLLVYSIRQEAALPAGSYRGILRFRVESLDSGTLTSQTLTVRMTVPEALGMEQSPASPSHLDFRSVAPGERSAEIVQELTVQANVPGLVELIQDAPEPFISGQGDRLPSAALSYALTSAGSGKPWQALPEAPERLLADPGGFVRLLRLAYAVEPPLGQRAGVYRGTIRLRLAGSGVSGVRELRLPMLLEVPEVFAMSVKPLEGGSRLDFGRAEAREGPVRRTMAITVTTNLDRPYQVLAGLDHALVLPTGEKLPAESLRWSVSQIQKGESLVSADSVVPAGAVPVYQSDAAGSSDSFLLVYQLSVPEDAKDGIYSGRIDISATLF